MTKVQPITQNTTSAQVATVNGISDNQVKARARDISNGNEFPTAERAELTYIAVIRNNIMLDNILTNQKTIIDNQNKIMQKLGIGENIDIKA